MYKYPESSGRRHSLEILLPLESSKTMQEFFCLLPTNVPQSVHCKCAMCLAGGVALQANKPSKTTIIITEGVRPVTAALRPIWLVIP